MKKEMDMSRSHSDIMKEVSTMSKLIKRGKYKEVIAKGWKFAKGWRKVEVSSATTTFWKSMGTSYMNINDFYGASKCFENALVTGPKDVEAVMGRSVAMMARGELNNAIAGFTIASKLIPKDPTPLILVGMGLEAKGKRKKSLEFLRKAMKINSRATVGIYSELMNAYIRNPKIKKSDKAKMANMRKEILEALS